MKLKFLFRTMNPTRAGKVAYVCMFISKQEVQADITFLDKNYGAILSPSNIQWIPYELKKL